MILLHVIYIKVAKVCTNALKTQLILKQLAQIYLKNKILARNLLMFAKPNKIIPIHVARKIVSLIFRANAYLPINLTFVILQNSLALHNAKVKMINAQQLIYARILVLLIVKQLAQMPIINACHKIVMILVKTLLKLKLAMILQMLYAINLIKLKLRLFLLIIQLVHKHLFQLFLSQTKHRLLMLL